ncbi:MAG: hypothetical protein AVDCRST_MAG85-4082 [uncultured Solirubrobacteraceae bacterium]|uniref:Uncharacterized protein n=1 Tax=uncultured Solirubrobacteraceae bacterium TaxID=1162706 RepID=A0A6J4U112_9ACTN|nr:MAG: hypothetical protein AVDCRST_MAG85-4082 [uncultured Solirubrobacteraceae bacterium]
MTRRDWLLLLLGLDPPPAGLEPVRVQKALFLLAREGGIPTRERYWFVPYNYGPMSPRVYRDVDALTRAGLVERVPVPGYAWGLVRATERGRERATELAAGADGRAVRRLSEIRREVAALSFADLLESVYERYPEFAVRSVFRRRGRP